MHWLMEILHAITLVDMDTAGYAATHWPPVWQELCLRAGAWTDYGRGMQLATELEQCEGRDRPALDSLLARLVQELGVTAGLHGQELHSRS